MTELQESAAVSAGCQVRAPGGCVRSHRTQTHRLMWSPLTVPHWLAPRDILLSAWTLISQSYNWFCRSFTVTYFVLPSFRITCFVLNLMYHLSGWISFFKPHWSNKRRDPFRNWTSELQDSLQWFLLTFRNKVQLNVQTFRVGVLGVFMRSLQGNSKVLGVT